MGGLTIRADNYSTRYYDYAPVFGRFARILCHGFIVLAGRGNTRWALQNSVSGNVIKVIATRLAHVDPYAETGLLNIDPLGAGADVRALGLGVDFRFARLPLLAELTSDEISIPEIVVDSTTAFVYMNSLDDIDDHLTIHDLKPIRLNSTATPILRTLYTNADNAVVVTYSRYRGERADAKWLMSCNRGHLTIEVSQEVTIKLIDPVGGELTGDVEVKSASYTVVFTSGSTPVLTVDGDGEVELAEGTNEHTFVVKDKTIAKRSEGNENARAIGHSTVAAEDHASITWSAWVFGRELVVDRSVSLEDAGELEIITTLAADVSVTSEDANSVPTSAGTFDDVYDMIHNVAVGDRTDLTGTVSIGVLDLGSLDIALVSSGDFGIASGTITIPCESSLEGGIKVKSIVTTGDLTIGDGVSLQGPVEDASGIRVLFVGLPADHKAVIACWPKTQGLSDRTNRVSSALSDDSATSILLTLAAGTEYHFTGDAVTYRRSPVGSLDTATQTVISVSLERIVDFQGNDLVKKASDLTSPETDQVALITWGADFIDLDISEDTEQLSFNAIAHKVELGQSTEEAQSTLEYTARIETARITFPASSDQKWRRKGTLTDDTKVPDIDSVTIGKDGSSDAEDFCDFSNGAFKYRDQPPVNVEISLAGLTVEGIEEDDFHGYLDSYTNKDDYKGSGGGSLTQATFNTRMDDLTDAIKDTFKADVSALTDSAHGLAALRVLIDTIPASQSDFDSLVDGLPSATKDALKADVSSLASSSEVTALNDLTASQIVAAIQAMDASASSGTQTLATVLDAIKTAVDAIQTSNSPTTTEIVTAISELEVHANVDFKRTLRVLLAVLAGSASLNAGEDEVTYSDPGTSGVDRAQHTVSTPDGTREGVLI